MYYAAKILQAAGLSIIMIGFIQKFPKLMYPKILVLGIGLFMTGWFINRFLLRK